MSMRQYEYEDENGVLRQYEYAGWVWIIVWNMSMEYEHGI